MARGDTPTNIPPDASRERRDRPSISESEKRVMDVIEKYILDKKTEYVGSGRSADVDILPVESLEPGVAPWVIKRETRLTREQELLGMDIDKEMDLQEQAYAIIEQAKERFPDREFARVPRALSRIKKEKNKWLIMEYVPGDTLMERTLKEFVFEYGQPGVDTPEDDEVSAMKKDELLDLVLEDPFINALPPVFQTEISKLGIHAELDERVFLPLAINVNRVTKGPSKILSMEQYRGIVNTIEAWHKSNFFRRDLHSSNIILTPDGGVSIIDFGLSAINPGKQRYKVETGNNLQSRIVQLIVDEEVPKGLLKIARKVK